MYTDIPNFMTFVTKCLHTCWLNILLNMEHFVYPVDTIHNITHFETGTKYLHFKCLVMISPYDPTSVVISNF